jgi:hypothetical protein
MILNYGDEKNFAMMAEDPAAARQMQEAFGKYGGDLRGGGRAQSHPQRDDGLSSRARR